MTQLFSKRTNFIFYFFILFVFNLVFIVSKYINKIEIGLIGEEILLTINL